MYGVLLSFDLWARQDFKLFKFWRHAKKGSSLWLCVLRLYLYFLVESNGLWLLMSPQVTPRVPLQSILNRWHSSQFCCRIGYIYSNTVIQTILNIFFLLLILIWINQIFFLWHILFSVHILTVCPEWQNLSKKIVVFTWSPVFLINLRPSPFFTLNAK